MANITEHEKKTCFVCLCSSLSSTFWVIDLPVLCGCGFPCNTQSKHKRIALTVKHV